MYDLFTGFYLSIARLETHFVSDILFKLFLNTKHRLACTLIKDVKSALEGMNTSRTCIQLGDKIKGDVMMGS